MLARMHPVSSSDPAPLAPPSGAARRAFSFCGWLLGAAGLLLLGVVSWVLLPLALVAAAAAKWANRAPKA